MAANYDFDPEDGKDELKRRTRLPLPAPRPLGAPLSPLDPDQEAPIFSDRYRPVEQRPQFMVDPAFDPSVEEIRHEKHFDFNPRAGQDIEDRRTEEWIHAKGGGGLPASGLQEWGYRRHPEMRPEPTVSPPPTGWPVTPLAAEAGVNDLNRRLLWMLLAKIGRK